MTLRGRHTYVLSTPGFVVDHDSVSLNSGRQVAWAAVPPATYGAVGQRSIPAGTIVAETEDGKLVPRVAQLTGTITVASGTATVTMTGHGYKVGDTVFINGTGDPDLDGTYTVATVPDANSFTFETEAADQTGTDAFTSGDAIGILVTSAQENSRSDSLTGYGVFVGGVFYENLLPDFEDGEWETIVTELGERFSFESYQDSRS